MARSNAKNDKNAISSKRPVTDLLKNRPTRVLTLDLMRERKKDIGPRGDSTPTQQGALHFDTTRKEPFHRFKPTTPRKGKITPKLTAAPVLREYIANKHEKKKVLPGCVGQDEIQEPSSPSNHNRNEHLESDLPKRRRLVLSPHQEVRDCK